MLPPAHERIVQIAAAREERERLRAEQAERAAAYKRERPFKVRMFELYGNMGFVCDLLVAAAAGLTGALEAVGEIDPTLISEGASELEQRRRMMRAWLTDSRVDPSSGFYLDEIPSNLRPDLLATLPDDLAAKVHLLAAEHGWSIYIDRTGVVEPVD